MGHDYSAWCRSLHPQGTALRMPPRNRHGVHTGTGRTHIVVRHFPCRFLYLNNNLLSGPIPGTIGSLLRAGKTLIKPLFQEVCLTFLGPLKNLYETLKKPL
jgi:hypothetical protein